MIDNTQNDTPLTLGSRAATTCADTCSPAAATAGRGRGSGSLCFSRGPSLFLGFSFVRVLVGAIWWVWWEMRGEREGGE